MQVNTLKLGNVFRDWLIDVFGDRIRNKRRDVIVYEIGPSSHTVCRYEFVGEDYSVIAKVLCRAERCTKVLWACSNYLKII